MGEKAGTSKVKQDSVEDDKEVISKNPNLELAQLRFMVNRTELEPKVKADKWKQLLELVKENEMGPYYELVCQELNTPIDSQLLTELREKNKVTVDKCDSEIKDAEENLGESEVRQAWLRKSEYLCQIGDKDAAAKAFRQTYEKTVGTGNRIDLVFSLVRLGLFFMDHQLVVANLAKAKDLMILGGDWERKNRLRSYEGLYKMSVRDFKAASELFLEAVPTFGSYELMSYEQLVFYTVVTCMLALDRPLLRSSVMQCSEIQEQLVGGGAKGDLVLMKQLLDALYDCQYDQFFQAMARLEDERLKFDRYLEPHYHFYARAMRLKAYEQFLTPYKTVRLDMMARDFGVSETYVDRELHGFIASGALNCRIDAVRGVVEMNHADSKNHLYKALIRDGDILLNRVQKLARVINE